MKNQISTALVAGALLVAGNLLAADDSSRSTDNSRYNTSLSSADHEMRASKLIGKTVKNNQNQTVCEIKDLIVDVDSGSTRYAIVNCGGVAGMGGKKIALPLNAIQVASDGNLTISATKEELEAASTSATGAWASASGQEWARGIDGYYGQPNALNSRFERESSQPSGMGREPVRSKGAQQQINQNNQSDMSSESLQTSVNDTIAQNTSADMASRIHVSINNGVVTLTGSVNSQSTKDTIESKVQSLPGVQRVDDQLTVQNR